MRDQIEEVQPSSKEPATVLKELKLGSMFAKIVPDIDPPNPIENMDFFAKFAFLYSRLENCGHGLECIEDAKGMDGEWSDSYIVKKFYVYDHSGYALKFGDQFPSSREYPFSCPWDTSVGGFAVVSKEDVRKEGWDPEKKEDQKKIDRLMEGELKTLEAWANGEVYTVIIDDMSQYPPVTCDACGGYYDFEHAEAAARDMLGAF